MNKQERGVFGAIILLLYGILGFLIIITTILVLNLYNLPVFAKLIVLFILGVLISLRFLHFSKLIKIFIKSGK